MVRGKVMKSLRDGGGGRRRREEEEGERGERLEAQGIIDQNARDKQLI